VEFIFIRRAVTEPWLDVMEKRLDYLKAGVKVVVILDPKTKSASVFRPTDRQEMLEADQTLTIPDVLPGFALVVGKLFE
jgi:Uma2 family endonuclease